MERAEPKVTCEIEHINYQPYMCDNCGGKEVYSKIRLSGLDEFRNQQPILSGYFVTVYNSNNITQRYLDILQKNTHAVKYRLDKNIMTVSIYEYIDANCNRKMIKILDSIINTKLDISIITHSAVVGPDKSYDIIYPIINFKDCKMIKFEDYIKYSENNIVYYDVKFRAEKRTFQWKE